MRAVVYDRYGPPDVLELRDLEKPAPKKDEILVRVRAAGLNPADWHFMEADPHLVRLMSGLRRPRETTVIGSDMSGVVERVGMEVTRFAIGDEVFAEVGSAAHLPGGCAEYMCIPENQLSKKPSNLTFAQAAAMPLAATTALIGVRDQCRIQEGQRVLINGASGGVGSYAVQFAKMLGGLVTAVCSSRNAEVIRVLGADAVIDYARQDFTATETPYDVLFDCVGNRSLTECRRALTPNGTYATPGGGGGRWLGPAVHQLRTTLLAPFVRQRLVSVNDKPNSELGTLKNLAEAGQVVPLIEREYPFEETAEAMRHLRSGHVRGKLVVTVDAGS